MLTRRPYCGQGKLLAQLLPLLLLRSCPSDAREASASSRGWGAKARQHDGRQPQDHQAAHVPDTGERYVSRPPWEHSVPNVAGSPRTRLLSVERDADHNGKDVSTWQTMRAVRALTLEGLLSQVLTPRPVGWRANGCAHRQLFDERKCVLRGRRGACRK
eukprot:scaffold20_cov361-Prasinococcus_capsulatus_cf.AAC.4